MMYTKRLWPRGFSFTDPSKRSLGIRLVYRRGDWLYLDICLWWKDFMFNICRVK